MLWHPCYARMDLHDLLPNVRQLAFLPHIRDLTIAYALAFLMGFR